jgi:hypothetical protein
VSCVHNVAIFSGLSILDCPLCFLSLSFNHESSNVAFESTGNQNVHSDEEQTIKWPKEKVLKDKQQSTKHTHKTKARVTRTPLKPGVNSCAPEG